ncbi:hypothetical protein M2138_000834 [Dysgonomonadaceae bacterium PH5-43]|nr:hypothetical protein [Dysgonomonadaceae bacterium PH5-43]
MNYKHLIFFLSILIVFLGCDSGDIYPEEEDLTNSRLISARFILKNTNTIPVDKERKLAFAAFSEESHIKPIRMVRISEAEEDREINIKLTKTSLSATSVALVITNQSSDVICNLYTQILPSDDKDFEFDGGFIDLASFHRLQSQLFNQSCITCHSKTNMSGRLNLESDVSYAIVNKLSKAGDKMLVEPGYVSRSLIVDKLTDYTIGTFHTTLSSMKEEDIILLRSWIENGARNN